MKIKSMKVGARNNGEDMNRLQQIHNLAVQNGATCQPAGKSVSLDAIKAMFDEETDSPEQEARDIQTAASALFSLTALVESEDDEPQDLAELIALMRGVVRFISGEIDEMEQMANQPPTKSAPGDGRLVSEEKVERPGEKQAPAGGSIAIPTYIKSLHLSLDEQRFKDVLAVKFVGKNEVQGYAALWGDPDVVDLETEFFTGQKSALGATDFWDKVLGVPRPLTWNHGQDPDMFKSAPVIGEMIEFGDDEVGRFYNAVLDRNHKYRSAVARLIDQKALGTSSDSAPQYVEAVKLANGARWLKTWPLFAAALTDVPCEPRMLDIGNPHWKRVGIDEKLLKVRIAEAGLAAPRETVPAQVLSADRELQLLKCFVVS